MKGVCLKEECPLVNSFCWHYHNNICCINRDSRHKGVLKFKAVGKSNVVTEMDECPLEFNKRRKRGER